MTPATPKTPPKCPKELQIPQKSPPKTLNPFVFVVLGRPGSWGRLGVVLGRSGMSWGRPGSFVPLKTRWEPVFLDHFFIISSYVFLPNNSFLVSYATFTKSY